MQKFLLILLIIASGNSAISQYTYRGKVISEARQRTVAGGEVRVRSNNGTRQRYTVVGTIDTTGHFSVNLKDPLVTLIIDCSLAGSMSKTVSCTDTVTVFALRTDCNQYNVKKAELDIEKGSPLLLCYFGYASYQFSDADRDFEKKYGISYYSFGDEPILADCMWLYNKTVAAWLDKKFGTEWRNEARWDTNLY
ncbi:MAG: hypothetical protein ABW019_10170 [Chitinophagaceae bacterium]